MSDIEDLRAAFPALEWDDSRGYLFGLVKGRYRIHVCNEAPYSASLQMLACGGWHSHPVSDLISADTAVEAVRALLEAIVAPALALGWTPEPAKPAGAVLPVVVDAVLFPGSEGWGVMGRVRDADDPAEFHIVEATLGGADWPGPYHRVAITAELPIPEPKPEVVVRGEVADG